eukprot:TRINITY_DN2213_c3_g1_i1.p1 TRINITY_DN2213_c3_g1~~TRINITY_DN2213_c3_g1_i1.p1  ORF type:complete len:391 (+),score=63.33 TRINITY_DN2213_c3_g1_i1:321-1493(+)
MQRKKKSGFMRRVVTFSRYGPQILHYDPGSLFFFGYAVFLKGTILLKWRLWCHLLFQLFITTGYAFLLCRPSCHVGNDDSLCPLEHFCLPSFDTSQSYLWSGLVNFLLSLFISLTFSRWWDIRSKIGVVVQNSNDLALKVAAYVVGDDAKTEHVREEIVRYLNLSFSVSFKQALKTDNVEDLIQSGLMTEREWKLLKPLPSRYMMVYYWVADLINQSCLAGRVPYPERVVPNMHLNITAARGAAADLFMYLNCQIPFFYAHLIGFMVNIHLLMISINGATWVGQGIQLGSVSGVIWGYARVIFSTLIYQGLLQLHSSLATPIGTSSSHFAHKDYEKALQKSTRAAIAQVGRTPQPNFFEKYGLEVDRREHGEGSYQPPPMPVEYGISTEL